MAIPQHIIHNVGGTISIDVLDRPTAARVTVKTDSGSEVVDNQAATVSTISTTLNAAASAGATSLTVAAATGISSGLEFWLRTPDEKVTCKSISGKVITLWQPILQDHANAVTAEGTLITYATNATEAATLFFDGRVEWELDGSLAHFSAVECTKYPLKRLAQVTDISKVDPMFWAMIESEANVEGLLDAAHEDVLSKIGSKARVRVYTGAPEFRRAVALQLMANFYAAQSSESAERMFERYAALAESEIQRISSIVPRDDDQDGYAAEQDERFSYRSVKLSRGG